MNLEQRVRLGFSYLSYLQDRQPQYALALSYRYWYADVVAEGAMKAFVRKLLSRMPRKTRKEFGGLVCAERHTEPKLYDSYHFHFLLWGMDESMPDGFDWLSANATRAATELYPRQPSQLCDCSAALKEKRPKTCRGGLSCRGARMTGRDATLVQVIDHTPLKAYEYVTSDIYKLDRPEGGQFLDLGYDGVTGSLLKRTLL